MVLTVVKETDDSNIKQKGYPLSDILTNFTGSTLRSLRLLDNEVACRLERNTVLHVASQLTLQRNMSQQLHTM
jgi:hypothetical protein